MRHARFRPIYLILTPTLLVAVLTTSAQAAETTITGGPSGVTNQTQATFEFTGDVPSGRFQCALEGATFAACTSPQTYTSLVDGMHTFQVRVLDDTGAPDPTPATRMWTVDTLPPDTSITSGPSGDVGSPDATFEFTASEPASFTCTLDGIAAPCTSPTGYSQLAEGPHTFMVRATDPAGNPDPTPAQQTWNVVVAPPEPDGPDQCPDTPEGLRPVARGCSAIELVTRPGRWIDPAIDELRDGIKILRRDGMYDETQDDVTDALPLIKTGKESIEDGDPCGAEAEFGRASALLDSAGASMLDDIMGEQDAVVRNFNPANEEQDLSRDHLELAISFHQKALLDDDMEESKGLQDVANRLCDAVVGEVELEGTVREVNDEDGYFVLDDDTIVTFPPRYGPPVPEGSDIQVGGRGFDDGSVRGDSIDNTISPNRPVNVACMRLRFAPVQDFSPPNTLHSPAAYTWLLDFLNIERGMRVAAEDLSCPGATPEGRALHYSMRVNVEDADDSATIAYDLEDGETPVPFPDWFSESGHIETTVFRTNCQVIGQDFESCMPPEEMTTKSYDVYMRALGFYSDTEYNKTVFGVTDDGVAGDFETAKVTEVDTKLVSQSANAHFQGDGYKVANGVSTKPALVTIGENQNFGVYEDDFFDPGFLWEEDQTLATGQNLPSSLVWPRMVGTRNGKEFWYFSDLPKIIHDRVAVCPTSASFVQPQGPERPQTTPPADPVPATWPPANDYTIQSVKDSFYKLPFNNKFDPGTGNMNVDDPNPPGRHGVWQAYALDLGADFNDTLRAARGGLVTFVEESDPWNLADPDLPEGWPGIGNYLFIRHEDGTYAVYFHMGVNDVFVSEGQEVDRGDIVGEVGSTGGSSGPHVHIGIAKTETHNVTSDVKRVRWEAYVGGTAESDLKPCYIPRSNAEFYSSNGQL